MTTIREILEEFVGQKLLCVSGNDPGEQPFAVLLFENGGGIQITLADASIVEVDYGEDE